MLDVLSNPEDEPRLGLRLDDDTGHSWVITKVRLYVDGRAVFYDAGAHAELAQRLQSGDLWSHGLDVGTHQVGMEMTVRWRGLIGKPGPSVEVRTATDVQLGVGDRMTLAITPTLKPFASSPFLERPDVVWREE